MQSLRQHDNSSSVNVTKASDTEISCCVQCQLFEQIGHMKQLGPP